MVETSRTNARFVKGGFIGDPAKYPPFIIILSSCFLDKIWSIDVHIRNKQV